MLQTFVSRNIGLDSMNSIYLRRNPQPADHEHCMIYYVRMAWGFGYREKVYKAGLGLGG